VKDNNYNKLDIHVEILVMAREGTLQGLEGNYLQAPPFFFFILEFLTTPILGVFCQFWIENKITFLKVVLLLICGYFLVVFKKNLTTSYLDNKRIVESTITYPHLTLGFLQSNILIQ
jgi:hypothetical protein